MRRCSSSARTLIVALGAAVGAAAWAAPAATPVSVTANPRRICDDGSRPLYPNFDLVIRNGSDADLEISELRGVVLNSAGEMIERRLIWQQSAAMLSPARTIKARGEAIVFNPISFSTATVGSRIRYELEFSGQSWGTAPAILEVSPQDCRNRYRLALPIAGRVLVYDGFDVYSHHRMSTYDDDSSKALGLTDNFQRYGLDLVVVDAQGRFYTGDGSRTSHWLGWGKPVRAAGSGRVAAAHDGQPDNVVIGTVDRWVERVSADNPMSSYGNYVLIEHGVGEFTLVGHLRQGSVKVRVGDQVVAGEVIAEIGNSGASGGVHVHFERRTGPGIAGMHTLPAFFSGLQVVGREKLREAAALAINSGDVVVAGPAAN